MRGLLRIGWRIIIPRLPMGDVVAMRRRVARRLRSGGEGRVGGRGEGTSSVRRTEVREIRLLLGFLVFGYAHQQAIHARELVQQGALIKGVHYEK